MCRKGGKAMAYKEVTCTICGKQFQQKSYNQHLCSDPCRTAFYARKGLIRLYKDGKYVKHGYNQAGEKNNNWKYGCAYRGKIPAEECAWCGSTENLLIHHKDENRKNNDPSNLICLCKSCHQYCHCKRDSFGRFTHR